MRIVVVGLGDSITAGNPGYDPDPVKQPFEGTDPESQYLYWAAQADPRIEFRNHGVGGERTDQILARFATATAGADVLVVQGGINDVVQKRSVEEAVRNLACMVARGRSLGLAVLLNLFGPAIQLSQWVLDVSPFTHAPRLPGGTVTAAPLLWLSAAAVVLSAAGLAALRRRDIA